MVEETTDDVTINIRMTEEKRKKEKKLLTLKVFERSRLRVVLNISAIHRRIGYRNLRLFQGPVDIVDKSIREVFRGQDVHIRAHQKIACVLQVSGGHEGKPSRNVFLSVSTGWSSNRSSRSQSGQSLLHREWWGQLNENRDRRINRWESERFLHFLSKENQSDTDEIQINERSDRHLLLIRIDIESLTVNDDREPIVKLCAARKVNLFTRRWEGRGHWRFASGRHIRWGSAVALDTENIYGS